MLYLISELREKERDNNNNNMTTRKTHNISVITSVGTKNIILPSYRYIHYLSDSNMPISRIVKHSNKRPVVVNSDNQVLSDLSAGFLLFCILILIGCVSWIL